MVALHGSPATTGEQLETLVEMGGDLPQTKSDHPRRGQLDGQRNTVQSPADLHDGGTVSGLQGQVAPVASARSRNNRAASKSAS
jgi:hypothetical protein